MEEVYKITNENLSSNTRQLILHNFTYRYELGQLNTLFLVLTEVVSKILINDNGKIKG